MGLQQVFRASVVQDHFVALPSGMKKFHRFPNSEKLPVQVNNVGKTKDPYVSESKQTTAKDRSQGKMAAAKQLLRAHWHATLALCSVFWSFGLCVAFLGPTLLDLGCKTQSVFATMSWVFFSQSLFILLGSASAGFLLHRFSPNILLFIGTTMMMCTMAVIPLCWQLWMLALILALMGFFMGTIDTVANVSMLRIYGKDVSPFLQTLHFFYGAGAFMSPMIAQPFLLNEDCSPFLDSSARTVANNSSKLPAATLEEAQSMTHIDYAFWILALIMAPVVLLTFSLVGRDLCQRLRGRGEGSSCPYDDSLTTGAEEGKGPAAEEEPPPPPMRKYQVVTMAGLCAIIMFLYDGLQAAYGGYVYSYAVKGPADVPPADAAFLNALFWGMFALGRLFSIPLATKLSPAVMLCGNVVGCTTGISLMLCFPSSRGVLVAGTVIMGVFMSSVFPTALSFTEQHVRVTPPVTSFLVFGAALGEMTMPVAVGQQFDKSPYSFLVSSCVLCMLSVVVYLAFFFAGVYFSKEGPTTMMGAAGTEDTSLMTQHVKYYSRMKADLSDPDLSAESKQ